MKKGVRKKLMLSLVLTCVLTIVIGLTYGVFTIDAGKYNATSMLISNLIYGIDIKTTGGCETINGKVVSLSSGNTSTVLVKITSLNPIDSNYSLEYKITEGEGKVYYASNTGWLPTGTISKDNGLVYIKTVKVVLEATTNMKVNFNVSGGYSYDTNIISLTGYNKITEPYNKSETYNNEENLKDIVCKEDTCEYGGQSNNNYLQYPTNSDITKNIWRILGVKENGIKIISNLTENTSVSNISNSLNTFYNTLENKEDYIYLTDKFNCSETGCETSTYTNIGLISTFEYNKVRGINSYLASSNNFFSLNNGTIENITPSKVEETSTSTTSGLRPVVYLKEDINVTGSGTSSDPYRIYSVGKVITTKYSIDSVPTTTLPSADTYIVKSVTCTGGREGHWDEGTSSVVLTKGNAPTTCTVDFTSGYTLTMKGVGATISGAGSVVVGRKGETSFTYTVQSGYDTTKYTVTCDSGASPTIIGNRVDITNIKESQTCTLTFKELPKYTVAVTSTNTSYGTITNGTQIVTQGKSVTITLNPATGYKYSSNTCGGTVLGNTLTISNITENKECTVTFSSQTYIVDVVVNNGTKSPANSKTVSYNGSTTFTIKASNGYKTLSASVSGPGCKLDKYGTTLGIQNVKQDTVCYVDLVKRSGDQPIECSSSLSITKVITFSADVTQERCKDLCISEASWIGANYYNYTYIGSSQGMTPTCKCGMWDECN